MADVRYIDRPDQLRALGDSNRQEILRALLASPATITQLGERLGRHPAWIRHHVLALERAGLAELTETRRVRGFVEKYYRAVAGAFVVDLRLMPTPEGREAIIGFCSDDMALELLAQRMGAEAELPELVVLNVGSLEGLIALRQGFGHFAGCHLLDADSGDYNLPYARRLFPGRRLVAVTLAQREQGLIVAPGNPLTVDSLEDALTSGARLVNRNLGSGTRTWLDAALHGAKVHRHDVPGYEDEVGSHEEVASAVAGGSAGWGVGLRAAAAAAGAGFVSLFWERYDLLMTYKEHAGPLMAPLLDLLATDSFRRAVDGMPGYDSTMTGRVIDLVA